MSEISFRCWMSDIRRYWMSYVWGWMLKIGFQMFDVRSQMSAMTNMTNMTTTKTKATTTKQNLLYIFFLLVFGRYWCYYPLTFRSWVVPRMHRIFTALAPRPIQCLSLDVHVCVDLYVCLSPSLVFKGPLPLASRQFEPSISLNID